MEQILLLETDMYLAAPSPQWFNNYNLVCSDMLCPPLCRSIFGKHLIAAVCVWPASAHLTEHVDFIRNSWGAAECWVLRCCACLFPTFKFSLTNIKQGHDYPLYQQAEVHPYAICISGYIPLKGRIMLWKANVIGSSTVLYNTAMAWWIRNWDIQHTHTHIQNR